MLWTSLFRLLRVQRMNLSMLLECVDVSISQYLRFVKECGDVGEFDVTRGQQLVDLPVPQMLKVH